MKISLLTFHYANNYGAILQCFALSKSIENWGHKIELLNLVPNKKSASITGAVNKFILGKRFSSFKKKYLPSESEKFSCLDELAGKYPEAECYIVGSDQVWNPGITKENFLAYFFSFLANNELRFSYAASFGIDEWTDSDKNVQIEKLLKMFITIGVRESEGVKICKDAFDINTTKVLDPTLLLTAQEYDKLLGIKNKKKKNVIVTYKFEKGKDWNDFLKRVSAETGEDILCLNENKINRNYKSSHFMSVQAWVTSIKNSSLVVTDSFHCMVFAIIYNKPFIALPANPKRVSRMLSLLKDLGLENRFYNSYSDVNLASGSTPKINYDVVNQNISRLRASSLEFLKHSIDLAIKMKSKSK